MNKYNNINVNRLESHATIASLFSDNQNMEFGTELEEVIPETEAEREAREEWEMKAEEAPEIVVFEGTCADIRARLFESPTRTIVIGRENANDNPYDGENSTDELPSELEKACEDATAETEGERDETDEESDGASNLSINWLQNAFATLNWSFSQLDDELKEEFSRQYFALKHRLLLRGRELGIKFDNKPRCNREYLLEEEEYEWFKPRFREIKKVNTSAKNYFKKMMK